MDTIPFVICCISVARFELMEEAHVILLDTTPHTASSGFLLRIWQDRAGYLRAFSGYQIIKKVPKGRGTRSNAGLGASGHIVFIFHSDSSGLHLSCGYALLRFIMILLYPRSLGR